MAKFSFDSVEKETVFSLQTGVIWTPPNIFPAYGTPKLFIEAVSADSLPAHPNLVISPDGGTLMAINRIPPGTKQTVPLFIRWGLKGANFYLGIGFSLELTSSGRLPYEPAQFSGASHMGL